MDFNLDGCAPQPFSIATISLCDIETQLGTPEFDSLFNISWKLHLDDNDDDDNGDEDNDNDASDDILVLGTDLRLFDVIASNNGLFPHDNTDFPGLGNYVIELMIDYNGNPFNYGTTTVTNNGIPLSAADKMTLYIVNISTPHMLSLFGLGFGFTAYRRRRKAKK